SLGDAFTALGFAFIMSVVARFGTAVTSAYGVGNRVISMITMFSAAVSMAVATMVGQFLGGDMVDKAKETLLKAAVVTFLIVGTICSLLFFYGEWITRFFITNPDVVQYGRTFFRYVSFSVPFFAVMNVLLGAFRGSGHTVQLTFINLLRLWGIRIPLVVLMSSSLGVRGIFIAMIISNILALAVTVVFLSNGRWAQKLI
ncbi:MAG: MATE family efflux transporter, partial [Thermotogaceae bacterium]|nr:MATE family efflux transporter [Thermotogaceae bacterium]